MKLRIKGNSVRFRLSQGELAQFKDTGRVEECLQIGTQKLIYALVSDNLCDALRAEMEDHTLLIRVPGALAEQWTATGLVGLSGVQANEGSEPLMLLVEKDFQCLHKRPGEDESDNFPNPESVKEEPGK